MRVLFLSGSLPPAPCGVGDYTHMLATALAAVPGLQVAVMTTADFLDPAQQRPYATLGIRHWRLGNLRSAWRVLRDWHPDIVHLQHPTQGFRGGLLPSVLIGMAALAGIKVVRTWHEAFIRSQVREFVLQAAVPGPYIVVRPDFERRLWRPLAPLLDKRRRVELTGGSAIPRSTLSPAGRDALRTELLGRATRLIAFFGFLYPEKGVELLLRAVRAGSDRVAIIGDDTLDPDYSGFIRAEAERLGVGVSWLGYLSPSATADALHAADAVLLPFRSGAGSWNSSVRAATLQNTPVVTTSVERSGAADDGQLYFVPPGDVDAMRTALDRVTAGARPDGAATDDWAAAAAAHVEVYRRVHQHRG